MFVSKLFQKLVVISLLWAQKQQQQKAGNLKSINYFKELYQVKLNFACINESTSKLS